METKLLAANEESLAWGAELLRRGELVAFPTETVYGLGANALDSAAVREIFAAKGRPADNPLIVHIWDREQLAQVCHVPPLAEKLMDAFWPGPLTLLMPRRESIPLVVTASLPTVAVRMPSHPVAAALLKACNVPVAAPSANTSGRPSPTRAEHVIEDMDGKIEMILDGGQVGIGVESTIVDVSGPVPTLLRPGAVTLEMLRETLGQVEVDPAILGPVKGDVKPKAPGMKYRHYAPKADMVLVEGAMENVVDYINREAAKAMGAGKRVGIICTRESRDLYPQGLLEVIGSRSQEETVAHNLFAVLRDFDDRQVDCIFSESFSEDQLGQAIMNRLCKAAGYHIVKCGGPSEE